ncbi:hypothetical protein FDC04_17070 [Clostridium botulinum]|nr:hypothetical protein [Clostridium botulinum]
MNNNKYFADNMNAVSTKVGNYTKQNMGQNNQQAGSQHTAASQATSTNSSQATSTATSTNAPQATSTRTSAAYSNQNTKKS